MAKQLPQTRITQDDAETFEEAYEARRIDTLPPALQALAVAHHLDQWSAEPSLVKQQAADFVLFCNTLGIEAQK
jgi:hypothetical protein